MKANHLPETFNLWHTACAILNTPQPVSYQSNNAFCQKNIALLVAFICTVVTDVTIGSFWLYWFILHGCSTGSQDSNHFCSAFLGTRFTILDLRTLQYVDHYQSPTPHSCLPLHGGAGVVCEGLVRPYIHPYVCYITLHTYM